MSSTQKALLGAAGAAGVGLASWRLFFPYIGDDIRTIRATKRTAGAIMKAMIEDKRIIDQFEAAVAKHPKKTFVIFEDKYYTYEFVDSMANRIANAVQKLNIKQTDTVAMMIYNEPAFVWTFLGLQKLGIAAAFVNFHLKSKPLAHSIAVSEAKALIVGEGDELLASIDEIRDELSSLPIYVYGKCRAELDDRYISMDDLVIVANPVPICKVFRQSVSPLHPICYIYTSGTTGLPKPAIINQTKAIGLSKSFLFFNFNENDIAYICTPLYHSAATVLGFFNTIDVGATILIGRKFSARAYFDEVREHNVTVVQYIGEMCRYLIRVPPNDLDKVHKVRVAIGNGLRPDIWEEFKGRFNIPLIAEFFGATEGTTGTWNILNKPGCIGRWSPLTRQFGPPRGVENYLVRHDPITYEPIRDKNGRCVLVKPGEEGLFISGVPEYITSFYKGTKEMNEKKIVRNAFKDGDEFFNFGDLFYLDKHYYMYFRDRVGDTFRWKSENVSTREVSDAISTLPFVQDANVYGVQIQGADGRAGMAAITFNHGTTVTTELLQQMYRKMEHELPSYARPIFLRILNEQIVTQTMKHRKIELVEEGFDPNKVTDPLYVLDNLSKTYVPLSLDNYSQVIHSKL
ncbi:long-chain fatty acid transport protein 6-like [Mytilus trossulus]|uniref:long-chain fatty acid transport protein 6-like n=1 Tax=Mytilus trossulus TaxID=6551 RepID=UPI0030050E3F